MKQLALLVCILFCQVLLSQELITDITNERNRDHIDFKKIEGINHISVRDYFGNFHLYQIDSNGEATLSYSEPLFTEPYTSFLENDNYLLYVRGDKAYIYDIVLREERIITTNESSDETKWVSIGNDKAILSYISWNETKQKVINLRTAETIENSLENELYYAVKNDVVYKTRLINNGAPSLIGFLTNVVTYNYESFFHSPLSTGSFRGKYFTHTKDGEHLLINTNTLKKTILNPDMSNVELFNIWNDIALFQSDVSGETNKTYETDLTTDITTEIEKLQNETKRIRVNDSLYLVKVPSHHILLNKVNGHSTTYSISGSFPTESRITDNYILLRGRETHLIDVSSKRSTIIPSDFESLKLMPDFSENSALMLLKHNRYTSSIYKLNKQTLELTEYIEIPINKFGLDNDITHSYLDDILLLGDNVYSIKDGNYSQMNSLEISLSDIYPHTGTINRTLYWSEKDEEETHLYRYSAEGREYIKSIPNSIISDSHDFKAINFLEKDEKLLAAIYHNNHTYIYDLTNEEPKELAQNNLDWLEIVAYEDGNILYGSYDLYILYPDSTKVLLDNIEGKWIYPKQEVKYIADEKFLVAQNGLFRLVAGEFELITPTQNTKQWSFTGSDYIIVADQNKYYKYTIGNPNTELVWEGYNALTLSEHEVLLYTADQSLLPQIFDANEGKYYLLSDYIRINQVDSWNSENNKFILSGYNQFGTPKKFKIIEIDKETSTVKTKVNIDVPTVESGTFRWSGDEGLLRVGNKAYVCDESFVLREISDFRAAQGNIHLVDGKYYLFGIHPTLGRQVYYISDLSQVMVNTTEYDQATNTLKIYPNPAQEYIQLEGVNEHASYSIFDINGKRIAHSTLKQSQISVSQLSAGTYFIHVMDGETISVGKVVVVR